MQKLHLEKGSLEPESLEQDFSNPSEIPLYSAGLDFKELLQTHSHDKCRFSLI